jgi:hypothetical protein
MNREPFLIGPDGMPFLGDLGANTLLPRPFDMFEESRIKILTFFLLTRTKF